MNCMFCGNEPEGVAGQHHILPTSVRKAMGWNGKRASRMLNQYKVPMCMPCHRKLNKLQEPLMNIIKYLRGAMDIPVDFIYMMDGVYEELIQHSELGEEG